MTTHYVDYTIALSEVQSGDISHLLARLWQRLHGVLAAQNIQHLGVSLPRLRPKHLGNVLRLHSDALTLEQVMANSGIRQLVEIAEIQVGEVQPTPVYCEYRSFTRNRTNEKLTLGGYARSEMRWLKRLQAQGKPLTVADLLARREHFQQQMESSPSNAVYLRLTSASTHQQFSLMVEASPLTAQAQQGKFSHYGLAIMDQNTNEPPATLPWFV